tara:strand:+ start:142921 stop:143628 length:708 start_codon:yes stop_codon:yes gene_type:complete
MRFLPINKLNVPNLLSLNAGFVDTIGFLVLHGLFTAHVTGNFVTLGASLVLGTSGAIAKILALPIFCAVVLLTRLSRYQLVQRGFPILRTFLYLMFALLMLSAVLAVWLGPFKDGDSLPAIVTGMAMVMAMAIQNAVQKVHLADAPPTTLMTGTTTQIMLDFADLLHGLSGQELAGAKTRLARMVASLAVFALGCAAGALAFMTLGVWCFVFPPLFVLCTCLSSKSAPILLNPMP